jgi:hypothetical protein
MTVTRYACHEARANRDRIAKGHKGRHGPPKFVSAAKRHVTSVTDVQQKDPCKKCGRYALKDSMTLYSQPDRGVVLC